MALIKITDRMADTVKDAGQTAGWTERMKRNGITDRLMVVCAPQTQQALKTRGLVEHIEGAVQEGPHKGTKNYFPVLTPAGELLRKYLMAGGEARSFGEYQLIENRLPYDKAGDTVRAQQAAEEQTPEGVCGHHKDPITTCTRPAGHGGQHRDSYGLFSDSVRWDDEPEKPDAYCSASAEGYDCTRDAWHTGQHEATVPGGRVVSRWSDQEPTDDHVAHTVKIWYVSGAYEEVGPLPPHHAITIYAECAHNERVVAVEIHGHQHELIRARYSSGTALRFAAKRTS